MRSLDHHHYHHLHHRNRSRLAIPRPFKRLSLPSSATFPHSSFHLRVFPFFSSNVCVYFNSLPCTNSLRRLSLQFDGLSFRNHHLRIKAFEFDEDSFDLSPLGDRNYDDDETAVSAWSLVSSSSDGEDSDGEYVVNPLTDLDLTSTSSTTTTNVNDALTVTAHRLALMGKHRKKNRIKPGFWINLGLVIFLALLLLFIDCCAWKIVRLPLDEFYLTRPFFLSAVIVSFLGYIFVPLLKKLEIVQMVRRGERMKPSRKREIPTMGGLFFIPIGIGVARFTAGISSVEVLAASVATLSFAVIGLLEDALTISKNHGGGISAWIKLILLVAVGASFSFWLDGASISSPYSMKMVVPLPAPIGLVCLGKCYSLLSSFCFVSTSNGVNLTNDLDGLAGGTAALAFIGMSIAVLPICSEIAIFGASMAGACVGFLLYNRYKASVLMGETGSLALGGALAAMAACTGMFLPLFISSGIFLLEASPIIVQVLYFRAMKHFGGVGCHFLRTAPFHHHLQLYGIKEPVIVSAAYCMASVLALFAGYVGLISA